MDLEARSVSSYIIFLAISLFLLGRCADCIDPGLTQLKQAQNYEMNPYSQPQQQPQTQTFVPLQEFLSRIGHVRTITKSLSGAITTITSSHQRTLDSADPTPDPALTAAIEQARAHIATIRDALRFLARDISITKAQPGASSSLVETKEKQLGAAKSGFEREVQRFLQAESDFQARYRDQIARQYRVVRPEATEAEVHAAMSADWSDQGVFQQALAQSSRQASAQRVLGRVRDRHVELRAIERTMAELAAVMQEMAVLIEEQQVRVDQIDHDADQTVQNLGEAKEVVQKSVGLARLVRRHKWMCLGLSILIICLIIGLGVGLYYTVGPGGKKL